MSAQTDLMILVALALLPPVVFLVALRNHEKDDPEPWRAVAAVFIWGGTAGVAIALLLHHFFQAGFQRAGGPFPLSSVFLAAVVIAPIVEEFAKATGLGTVRRHIDELEDGIIYGAGVGLGFAATENLVYGLVALDGGFGDAIVTVGLRVFSSTLLHATASALIGYGYGRAVLRGGGAMDAAPHYLVAVLLHAGYNYLMSQQAMLGFIVAVVLVLGLTGYMRRQIRRLDAA